MSMLLHDFNRIFNNNGSDNVLEYKQTHIQIASSTDIYTPNSKVENN